MKLLFRSRIEPLRIKGLCEMGGTKYFLIFLLIITFQNCSPFESSSDFLDSSSFNQTLSLLKCQPDAIRAPKDSVLRRLNTFELKNTLEDVIGDRLDNEQKNIFMQYIEPLIATIPDDTNPEGMNVFDQTVSSQHVEKYFELGDQIGQWLATNPLRLAQLTNCAAPLESTCVRSFIENFGLRSFRRPLSNEEVEKYMQIYQSNSGGYQNLITVFLSSPSFIYHLEFGSEFAESSNENETIWLGPYERASKLSYFILQSAPDETLLKTASNNSIMQTDELVRQVERLMSLPKARRRLADSFANQWMKLDNTPLLEASVASVLTRWEELRKDPNKNDLRPEMIQEVKDYFFYMMWEQQADFRQLMTSDLVFPKSEEMATIYSTPIWSGSFNLTDLVRAPSRQRAGPLTRAQFLYTGTNSTRPIMRGVEVYRNYLCGQVPTPAENETPEGVVFEDHFTGREIVQAMTEVEGTSCVGCHKGLINPLAFPFEVYDAFGKFRENERVFHREDGDNKGQVLTVKPVDGSSTINLPNYLQGSYSNGVDMIYDIADSPRAHLCMDIKLFSFALKQDIHFGESDCAIQDIYTQKMQNGGSIVEAIRAIAIQPEFMKRTMQ